MAVVARKTLAALRRNAKNVSVQELRRVLEDNGWVVRGGTKHGFVAEHARTGRTFPFPRPHDKYLLPVYVRAAVKAIEDEQED